MGLLHCRAHAGPVAGGLQAAQGTLCHTVALHEPADVGQDAAILLGEPLSLSSSQGGSGTSTKVNTHFSKDRLVFQKVRVTA